jgi:hypothetical protein
MTDEAGLIGLLHRADWTRLRLSARLGDGSTVMIAPGKRYRFETAGYVTGCDGGRPWELPGEDDDDDDEEVHWISGPEPPARRLLCPAWLLEGSPLEMRGRVRVCGREALDVVASTWSGAAEAAVDAEFGILLQVAERGNAGPGRGDEPDVLELVTADFDPVIDPAIFRPPPGSLRAEGLGEALGGGGLAWSAAKAAAGLAAGGLGAWIRHGPQRQSETPDGPDYAPAIPDPDPAPAVSPDGRPAAPLVADDVLALLHAGGPGGFSATMHQWFDVGGLASAVPASARRSGFGGLGYLMDAVSEQAGAARLTSALRIAGPTRYRIDRTYGPRSGPLTIGCDGSHVWRVYADKVTRGPAGPPPSDVRELADPSWLLRCWLAGGTSVLAGGRPAYRIDVVKRRDQPSISMMFPAAVAVVDAELGIIVRLTSYIGGTPVQKYELENLEAVEGDFRVELPDGLPFTEAGPLDDLRSAEPGGPPLTLGRVLARQAAAEVTRVARSLFDRLGTIGPRDR